MGRSRRNKPVKLSHKLLAIRRRLRMSQTEMARALELKVHYSAVSNYELGTREPDLIVVLRYARLAGVPMEMLVDDKMNLPERYEQVLATKGTETTKEVS
jgi:transcriptional regulator with XRE-family HTH domain